jgi:hypothetical protein
MRIKREKLCYSTINTSIRDWPKYKRCLEILPKEWHMQHSKKEIGEGLPDPHWRKEKVEKNATQQADLDRDPPAEDKHPERDFIERDECGEEGRIRCNHVPKERFIERDERIGYPLGIELGIADTPGERHYQIEH